MVKLKDDIQLFNPWFISILFIFRFGGHHQGCFFVVVPWLVAAVDSISYSPDIFYIHHSKCCLLGSFADNHDPVGMANFVGA